MASSLEMIRKQRTLAVGIGKDMQPDDLVVNLRLVGGKESGGSEQHHRGQCKTKQGLFFHR